MSRFVCVPIVLWVYDPYWQTYTPTVTYTYRWENVFFSSVGQIGEGAHTISEEISYQREGDHDLWDSVSVRMRQMPKPDASTQQLNNHSKINPLMPSREDALTNRPLNLGQEESTRKTETDRWLNSHFGSSNSSLNSDTVPRSPTHPPTGIHVTMTSRNSPYEVKRRSPPQLLPNSSSLGRLHSQQQNQVEVHQSPRSQSHIHQSQRVFAKKPEKVEAPVATTTTTNAVGKRISFDEPATNPTHNNRNLANAHFVSAVSFNQTFVFSSCDGQ